MWHEDHPLLAYRSPGVEQPAAREFPWGILSLSFGLCAALVVPIFDAVARVPGYLQSPILLTEAAAGLLAIGSGIVAAFARIERARGIVGVCLGLIGLIVMPMLARA